MFYQLDIIQFFQRNKIYLLFANKNMESGISFNILSTEGSSKLLKVYISEEANLLNQSVDYGSAFSEFDSSIDFGGAFITLDNNKLANFQLTITNLLTDEIKEYLTNDEGIAYLDLEELSNLKVKIFKIGYESKELII